MWQYMSFAGPLFRSWTLGYRGIRVKVWAVLVWKLCGRHRAVWGGVGEVEKQGRKTTLGRRIIA